MSNLEALEVKQFTPFPNSFNWRGFGGTIPTVSTVGFDRQLDKIAVWLENWNHNQRCAILEKLLVESNLIQVQLVWSVIQPALHRDFMYAAKREFPAQTFTPISTHTTRELKRKVTAMRQDNYHRIGSAHLQHYNQVKEVNIEVKGRVNDPEDEFKDCEPELRLPSLHGDDLDTDTDQGQGHWKARSVNVSRSLSNTHSSRGWMLSPKRQTSCGQGQGQTHEDGISAAIFDGQMRSSLSQLHTAPPCMRFIEMPSRRHIQDEESPRVRESGLSMASNISLRDRKKNNTKKNKLGPEKQALIPTEGRNLLTWYMTQWNSVQRNEFLHKFLLKLDPRQHYFMSSYLAIRQFRDFISLLSEPLALRILQYLHPFDLVRASKTSKTWHRLCNDNELWRLKCLETKLDIPVEVPGANKNAIPNWKKVFRENMFVKLNWQTGKCNIVDCKGHTDKVLSVTFDRKRLATGSQDRSIRLWSLKDGRCLQTLTGHSKGVWCLRFLSKHLLVSGSYDCTIKVWNLRDGVCLRTLLSHEGPVWAMVLRNNMLVSGSQDRTAKVWEIGKCLLLLTLRGHNGAVFAVDLDDKCRMVLTGSADKTVRLWNAESGQCLRTVYVSQTTSIMAVSYSKGHFACCYGDTICLYSINEDALLHTMHEHKARAEETTEKPKQKPGSNKKVRIQPKPAFKPVKLVTTLNEHIKRIESLQLTVTGMRGGKIHGHIVSAGKDGELKYWDVAKGCSVQTYAGSKKGINCIHCDETRIAAAALDNKVKIYDFNIS